jgi:hypothetical protein
MSEDRRAAILHLHQTRAHETQAPRGAAHAVSSSQPAPAAAATAVCCRQCVNVIVATAVVNKATTRPKTSPVDDECHKPTKQRQG